MTPRLALTIGSLALLFAAATSARAASKPDPCGYPSNWKIQEIARAVSPSDSKGRTYVLAWKVVEDDRPLRVESCLVLQEIGPEEGGGYFLAHLYRHPGDKKPEWNVAMTHVSGEAGTDAFPGLMYTHLHRFEARPKNEELSAALAFEEVNWTFEIEEGWKVLGRGVCEANWREALGEKPARLFPAASAKAPGGP